MRKIMSVPEWIGVAVMLVGIGMGYYGSVGSTLVTSRALGGMIRTVSSTDSVEGLGNALGDVSARLGVAAKLTGISGIGVWTFWLGLCIFVIASRVGWNAALRTIAEHSAAGSEASQPAG